MIIHVVQPDETIYSIAEIYNVPVQRLIEDNGLLFPDSLVIGQTIVIAFPEDVYIVKEGDTLADIAKTNGITIMELLRNNPFLSGENPIYPGDYLVIRYKDRKLKKISTNGYASPYIDNGILQKNLPFLTYISIYGYHFREDGTLMDLDDQTVIQIAKRYGVASLMFLTPINPASESSDIDILYKVLRNDTLLDNHINSILGLLKSKGYYGLNIGFQFIEPETVDLYEHFFAKLVSALNIEGFPVYVTLVPRQDAVANIITYQKINYAFIGNLANRVTLLTYNWGYAFGPPAAVTSVFDMKNFLDFIILFVPEDNLSVGVSIIGYNWQLPYMIGISRANAISHDSALVLAYDDNVAIQFDNVSQNPFFRYVEPNHDYSRRHIVWFVDARTVQSMIELLLEYNLSGMDVWNIMQFCAQLWLIINIQFDIEKIFDIQIDL